MSTAFSDLTAGASDTYNEVIAWKKRDYELAREAVDMLIGFFIKSLGRTANLGAGTLTVANAGLGAARQYTEMGTGFLVDTTQRGINAASDALSSVGESTLETGQNWLGVRPNAAAASTSV